MLDEVTSKFMLRRLQKDTLREILPPKHEVLLFCKLSEKQSALYEELSSEYWSNVEESGALNLLIDLRLVCAHPNLLTNVGSELHKENLLLSGKLLVLKSFLEKIFITNEKVVVVSNFTSVLDVVQCCLKEYGWTFLRLDGKTKSGDRQFLVDRFNREDNKKSFVFLLSSKGT